MTREEKAASVADLHERFAKASVALIAANKGMSVAQATRLRRTVKAAGGEYKVAKHTLVRRAVANTRFGKIDTLLEGPRALVFGYDDPIAVAKALVEFANQTDKLRIEGGAVEGQIIEPEQVKSLASMPGLDSLRARIATQAMAPGRRLASMVAAPASRIAGAIQTRVKKAEEAGTQE